MAKPTRRQLQVINQLYWLLNQAVNRHDIVRDDLYELLELIDAMREAWLEKIDAKG